MRRISPDEKSVQAIAEEWDRIAEERNRQIRSGLDDSMSNVLAPAVLNLLDRTSTHTIVDIGCGTGWLTARLSAVAGSVIGIDVSKHSIELARREPPKHNVEYVWDEFESFSQSRGGVFTVAIANMTLITVLHLDPFIKAVSHVLQESGHFVLTIAHPCFWPTYWGYAECPWFNYLDEIPIEAPFRIAAETTDLVTTHVHRPLGAYMSVLWRYGFVLEEMVEMVGKGFRPPRFLAIKCHKDGKA
jgi:SAM-dependent methyltransferase